MENKKNGKWKIKFIYVYAFGILTEEMKGVIPSRMKKPHYHKKPVLVDDLVSNVRAGL